MAHKCSVPRESYPPSLSLVLLSHPLRHPQNDVFETQVLILCLKRLRCFSVIIHRGTYHSLL